METPIVVAIVGAAVALSTSIASLLFSWKNANRERETRIELTQLQAGIQAELERSRHANQVALQDKRDTQGQLSAEQDAWRAYAFEARKRLYQDVEPLRAQMAEACHQAASRVRSLARSAQRGEILPDGQGWLADPRGYYALVTAYDLLQPALWFRLIQPKISAVDFSLDARAVHEHHLSKLLYKGWAADFRLAQKAPELPYDPNLPEWPALRQEDPAQYWRQGIPMGRLDSLLEAMTQDGHPLSFGRFEATVTSKEPSELQQLYDSLMADLLTGFHPETRPVLWRVLNYQVCAARAYHQSWTERKEGPSPLSPMAQPEASFAQDYAWKPSDNEATLVLCHERLLFDLSRIATL